ncbi:DUF1292 domain-containing protein [Shimazuella alba]|jgi:hypothetical protein|uniref:DUF1292 domain-containing protein n=1 Tax=Shimazuella alba TaxID=2690964 RepID=A0A6I4VRN4_9BACL|nr:DUF1292 domain-containing protein [Shimazuella alba]MXQ54329.1 DUF1292 domain-containing protein [Shimazuella alba]
MMREVTHLRDTLEDGVSYIHTVPMGEETLRVLHEVEVNGNHYALMQGMHHGVGEAYLYEVHKNGQIGEIETVDEWESVIDAVHFHLNTYYD